MDALGHVYTDIHMRTGISGVYACGDARADSTRQLGAAVGDGITAALAAYHDLNA
jgi:thioredoxin reductase (NADPH)